MSKRAHDFGIIDTYAAPNKVMLDYDNVDEINWAEIDRRIELMGLYARSMFSRRTARGWHVLIILSHDYAPMVLIAAQAILGSDPRREALNFRRARRWPRMTFFELKRWQVLFGEKLK